MSGGSTGSIFCSKKGNKLLVTLDIDKRIQVGRGSKAVLADAGVLGGKLVILQINQAGAALEVGDTLVSGKEAGLNRRSSRKKRCRF
jgi:phospholipid/cholesterol/gamma-HCH transport system substrate-binding protein